MTMCRLAVLILAAQCALTSAAVVHHANVRAASVPQKTETLAFSAGIWNNTMTRFMQHEILMTEAEAGGGKVDKVMYVIFSMMLGCCGCDRCFMGQIGLGCLKGFTFGGFMIWHLIDFFTCVYVALTKMPKIQLNGYDATFKPSTIEHAFWACIILLCLQIFNLYNQHKTMQMQMEQQRKLVEAMNAAAPKNGAADQEPATLEVSMGHQTLAHVPTKLSKMLRKAGVLHKDPTIPELIGAFQTMDKDGDGQLDPEEIKEALTNMGVSDEDVAEMIKQADTDGDGKISKDEFLAYHAEKAKKKAAKLAQAEAEAPSQV